MESRATYVFNQSTIRNLIFDLAAIAFIYFVPAISHLLSLPVYYIEPMRLMLILALVHTNQRNAYIIALTLPLFSFLVSAHPVLPKMLLITFELSLNVFLFYLLIRSFKNTFFPVFISIIASKLIYYVIKFGLINWAILESGLVSTPILMQGTTALIFSTYVWILYKKK
ncbi:MAG: hypothetical protein V2I54_11600 [Bacteroidales bacterium]|jgi:hypothetical protein|nr:hypothetical protein [Bacteroidales bacterium]